MQDALDVIVTVLAPTGELSGVSTIVEKCGGLHRIELLQHRSCADVRSKAVRIWDLLFPDEIHYEQTAGKGGMKDSSQAPKKDLSTYEGMKKGHNRPGRWRNETSW